MPKGLGELPTGQLQAQRRVDRVEQAPLRHGRVCGAHPLGRGIALGLGLGLRAVEKWRHRSGTLHN
eukprot:7379483-Lingulodinium_polyedra.AAC.1